MKRTLLPFAGLLLVAAGIQAGEGARPEAAYRVTVLDPEATPGAEVVLDDFTSTVPWRVGVPVPPATNPVPVELGVILVSRVEPCASRPEACDGSENFQREDEATGERIFGCRDRADNNGNGLVDLSDPDCRGVLGWSLSVVTEPCFHIRRATTRGTAAQEPEPLRCDLREPRDCVYFEKSEIVNPSLPANAGREGAVTAVVLSFEQPVMLPQVEDSLVLRLTGAIEAAAPAPPGALPPCAITMLPSEDPGLVGSGEPVRTAITLGGDSVVPPLVNATLEAVALHRFRRGDANDDGRLDIADPIRIASALFRQGPEPACDDAADANDDGFPDLSDVVYLIRHEFLGGSAPPAPFPDCGTDALHRDGFLCEAGTSCLP